MRAILLILLIVAGFSRLHAQTQRLFSSDHDISSSMVNHVLEDSHGMIWVATEDGLNRYDGAKFTIYRNIPGDSTSLSHNLVRAIFEDRDGNLLVGTFNGMQIYDREHDCFSPRILTNGVPDFTGSVSSFFQRKNGEIWVVAITPAVIDSIRDGKAFTRPVHKGEERLAKSHRGLEDKHGNIFMLQSEDGICRIDSKGKVHTLLGRPGDPVMESITEDKDGNVYLGSSNKGLFRYDAVADKVIPLNDPNASYFLIKHIYADDDGSLYLATDGGGLKKYTPSDGKTSTVVEGMWDFDPRSSKTHSVIKDRNGNLWLGIFQRGVKVISEKNFHFKYLGKKSPVFDLIGSYCITAIKRDSSGRLWVGTDNDGIYALSPDHTSSRHYDGGNIPHIITSVFEDRQGRIWAGSFRQGAGVIDPATGSFRDVPIVSQNGKKVTRVYDFAQDNKGYIWIASMGFGLFRHDPATGSTIQFNVPGSRIDSWVCALHYSPARDILYLGTYNGFDIISGVTTKPKHTHLADGKIIFSIREDHKGTIWASSSDGIIKMNHGDPEMKIYSMSDGLPSNNVYSLETDGDVVWIATNFGLSRFDTKSNSFSNFYTDDGLQGNEFYKNASFADKSGVLYFGGLNGITFFRPDALNDVRADLSVRVTDFYIRGKGVRAGMKSGSRDIISVPVYEAEEFHLSYADNSFSVEFAARELERAQNMQYLYSFDDEKWSSLPIGSHRVNFSDVAPGRHTIRLKAIEKGVESEEKRIFVDIAPPWYLSIWAKILYSLLIAVAICGSFVMAHFRIKKRNEILEQEYVKQMNEAKLQFFFNISHEIRTPMSLVIGPLEKLMKIDQDSDRNQSYRLIFRNAKRVLRLINELLDVRKIDRGQMRLNYTRTEIVPFIEDICYTFSEAMAAKNISFSFCHEGCDSLKAWIDLSNFDKVIVNILSNALKYTPNGGKIVINLSREPETDEMIISVTDSGQGVPDKEKEKIFNRFYQAEGHVVSGSGLGLHLTRQLVNLHGGNISVSDNPEGKGTRFTVTVPIEKPENASVAPPGRNLRRRPQNRRTLLPGLHAKSIFPTWRNRPTASLRLRKKAR